LISRLWRLLERPERRKIAGLAPLLALSALVEVVGVAAVIPFLALLAEPAAADRIPIIGAWLTANGRDPSTALRIVGGALAAIVVLANLLVIVTNWWLYRYSSHLTHTLSSRLLRHYLTQPYDFSLGRNSATLANRITVQIGQLVGEGVRGGLEIVARSTVIIAMVAFLVVLDTRTAVISFACLGGIYGAIFLASRRYLQRIGREAAVAGAARLKVIFEALGGFKELRVAGRESSAHQQYQVPSRRAAEIHAAMMTISGLPRTALEAVAVGGLVLIASLLTTSGSPGTIGALPLLGAYAFAGLRIMPAMQILFAAFAAMRFATGALEGVEADFRLTHRLEALSDEPPPALAFSRSIELRDVTFAYPDSGTAALDRVSLEIRHNRSLAIIGKTGSGKTTLIDVLLGLLEPELGGLYVDGQAVTSDRIRAYRRMFGYVPQTIFLLDDTIARNVAFGMPDAAIDHAAVERACREAQIADFIEGELPQQYQTRVGERGLRLSGGQRQRIGIARALYHRPAVLLFDEATSALDLHTERHVFESLARISLERTVVMVAHRLDTVEKADWVVVMEGGRVSDSGEPREVLARYRSDPIPSV
jgi:ATP-binding cassette, subfamily B, bacterial PglK